MLSHAGAMYPADAQSDLLLRVMELVIDVEFESSGGGDRSVL